ncbi:MAG: GAF domain-containing sensor histidine kinase [Caldilineaceae bacterium]
MSNLTTALADLAKLNLLLEQERLPEYLSQGITLLCDAVGAQSAVLRLYESDLDMEPHTVWGKELGTDVWAHLESWEKSGFAGDVFSTWTAQWSCTTGHGQPCYRILHIRLAVEQITRGVLCFVFLAEYAGAERQLIDGQTEELLGTVQLFMGVALRTTYLRATRKRLEQAQLLYQISQSITSSLDLKKVFHQTTELAASILEAQAATLFTVDERHRELVFLITKGAAAQVLEEKRIPLDQGVVGWVATNGKPLIVNDTRKSAFFNSDVDSQTGFSTRNIVCVPLRIHERTVGILEVLNKDDESGFTADDAEWLSTMGQQIAIALENAQLYENLRQEQDRIIKAQEEVRNHLARELHDNTAQMLSLIIMNMDLAQQFLRKGKLEKLETELQRIEEYAKQANREVRTLLFELRPIILESRGLIPALHAYHRQLQASMGCEIHLKAPPLGFEISMQGASIIFSIIQEAVNNIRKHAHAQNIWIRVDTDAEHLRFEVEDDGIGFDPEVVNKTYAESGSFGLLNMRERAAMLAGKLQIQSPRPHAAKGVLITGFIPLSGMIRQTFARLTDKVT